MAAPSETLVRVEVVALALNCSMNHARRAYLKGNLPAPDVFVRKGFPRPACWWKLSALAEHDPHLARRCAAILAALDPIPLKAA